MPTTNLKPKIDDFFAQKRIAIVGVSRNKSNHPAGNLIYHRLEGMGHDVVAVNPYMPTFNGVRCYPDVKSIPGGVDAAVIITRPEVTARVVRECADVGVRRIWMHSSAAKGSSVSKDAIEFCMQHDMSVIAGACPMMYGPRVDFGHTCLRLMLQLTGGLPL